MSLSSSSPPNQYVSALSSSLRRSVVECKMEKEMLAFFKKLVDYDSVDKSRKLNECQKVAAALLHRIISNDKASRYSFDRKLGIGYSGFTFNCKYNVKDSESAKGVASTQSEIKKRQRAIKVVIIEPSDAMFVHGSKLTPMSAKSFHREIYAQQALSALRHSHIRVCRVYSHGIVIAPKNANAGVVVMDRVVTSPPNDTSPGYCLSWSDMVKAANESSKNMKEMIRRTKMIPYVLSELQKIGVLHNDLHSENIVFHENKKVTLLDLGRTLGQTPSFFGKTKYKKYLIDPALEQSEGHRVLARILDFMIPMYPLIVSYSNLLSKNLASTIALFNVYVVEAKKYITSNPCNKLELLDSIDPNIKHEVKAFFKPVDKTTATDLRHRYNIMIHLVYSNYFGSKPWIELIIS